MKIVYSWLKDFVDINVPAEELADALTSSGLEVASIVHRRIPAGIVAARVLEKEKHPNADKLSVCKVDNGTGEPLTIVCGAPNVAIGMHVPLATIGTTLGPDFTIKKSKLRGVESSGMLCSEKELGISEDNSGLMALPLTTVPGKPMSDYFPDDAVIEIELTPNRGDCLSYIGVAREIAARFGLPLKPTAKRPEENSDDPVEQAIRVTTRAPERCPRYTGRLIRNVKIAPSPEWLRNRLALAGMRPINNVVDITNYMLLHFGQPMHAFDYDRISGHAINVDVAGKELAFVTLDAVERSLRASDLLIADNDRPVALAGIMGGAGSEITDATINVFLECAFFEQTGIRATAKRLGLSTDSSYRFERGVDPDESLIDALDTAAAMFAELADGSVAKGRIDVYPTPLKRRTIAMHPEKASRILGVGFSGSQIVSFLESLQIECKIAPDDVIMCTVPLYRHDITIEEDLVEEIGRLYGYDNIPSSETQNLPLGRALPQAERINDTIRTALAYSGLCEAVTNSLTSEKKWSLINPEINPVRLLNPLTPDMALMRTTLAGSLLDITAYNCNRKNGNNRFFEVGKIFEQLSDGSYRERDVVAILLEGNFRPATWNSAVEQVTFYHLKGIIEAFGGHLGYTDVKFANDSAAPSFFGTEKASVTIGSAIRGFAGVIDPKKAAAFEVSTVVCYAQLDITDLLASSLPLRSYKPLPKYPALERDFCFVMDEKVGSSEISDAISSLSPLIEKVVPFDVFRGDKLGSGKKSIAFSTSFRTPDKTLTDKDVEELCGKIVSTVAEKFGAVLRS